ATPAASPATTPMASPVTAAATPVASPVASLATSIDAALLRGDLSAAVTSVVSCLDEGKAATVARWTSDTFRGQLIGSGAPVSEGSFTTLFQALPPISYRVRDVRDVRLVDSTTATANIVWQMAHQVRTDQWTFALKTVQGVPVWTV